MFVKKEICDSCNVKSICKYVDNQEFRETLIQDMAKILKSTPFKVELACDMHRVWLTSN